MKFVKVLQEFETFISGVGTKVAPIEGYINIDNIELIRVIDNKMFVSLIGNDKMIKISDKDSINRLLKECKIKSKEINE